MCNDNKEVSPYSLGLQNRNFNTWYSLVSYLKYYIFRQRRRAKLTEPKQLRPNVPYSHYSYLITIVQFWYTVKEFQVLLFNTNNSI